MSKTQRQKSGSRSQDCGDTQPRTLRNTHLFKEYYNEWQKKKSNILQKHEQDLNFHLHIWIILTLVLPPPLALSLATEWRIDRPTVIRTNHAQVRNRVSNHIFMFTGGGGEQKNNTLQNFSLSWDSARKTRSYNINYSSTPMHVSSLLFTNNTLSVIGYGPAHHVPKASHSSSPAAEFSSTVLQIGVILFWQMERPQGNRRGSRRKTGE